MTCPDCHRTMELVVDEALGQSHHCPGCDLWIDVKFDKDLEKQEENKRATT